MNSINGVRSRLVALASVLLLFGCSSSASGPKTVSDVGQFATKLCQTAQMDARSAAKLALEYGAVQEKFDGEFEALFDMAFSGAKSCTVSRVGDADGHHIATVYIDIKTPGMLRTVSFVDKSGKWYFYDVIR